MEEDVTPVVETPELQVPVVPPEPETSTGPEPTQTVPYDRFSEVIREKNAVKAELEALKASSQTVSQPAPPRQQVDVPQEPQEFSPDVLQNAVDDGRITAAQMNGQLALQTQRRSERIARETTETVLRERSVRDEYGTYAQLMPDLNVPGTPSYNKFQTELSHMMTNLGAPDNIYTRAAAARSAFGTPDGLRQVRNGTVPAQTVRDVGGGRPSANPTMVTKNDPIQGISDDEKRVYADMIERGHYSGWQAVRDELRHSKTQKINPRLRA